MVSLTDRNLGSPISTKQKIIAVAVALLSFAFAGILGVLAVGLMYWLSQRSIAVDSEDKHGISHQTASRLGGAAIFVIAIAIHWSLLSLELPFEEVSMGLVTPAILWAAVLVGAIGLYEDIVGDLPPLLRLGLTSMPLIVCILLFPELLPTSIGVPGLDYLLSWKPVAFVLALLAGIALLNASNMADGANGLMPTVFVGIFLAYFFITLDVIYLSVASAVLVFAIFNIFQGRLFLGDAGAYGLGALGALGGIYLVASTEAEVWLLLCLAGYPVIDFFASVIRRVWAGKSPLSADNDHMHNRLYQCLKRKIPSPLLTNSVSGLIISLSTTGVALILMFWWELDSVFWLALFLSQIIFYVLSYRLCCFETNSAAG